MLHQHFIVENCGEGIRLRAYCSVTSSGCFLFCPDDASDVYTLLHGSCDDQMWPSGEPRTNESFLSSQLTIGGLENL